MHLLGNVYNPFNYFLIVDKREMKTYDNRYALAIHNIINIVYYNCPSMSILPKSLIGRVITDQISVSEGYCKHQLDNESMM